MYFRELFTPRASGRGGDGGGEGVRADEARGRAAEAGRPDHHAPFASKWAVSILYRERETHTHIDTGGDVYRRRWPTFADVSLLDEAPEHVSAVMAISRLVKSLFGENVAVCILWT